MQTAVSAADLEARIDRALVHVFSGLDQSACCLFLLGSQARGEAGLESDVDLGILLREGIDLSVVQCQLEPLQKRAAASLKEVSSGLHLDFYGHHPWGQYVGSVKTLVEQFHLLASDNIQVPCASSISMLVKVPEMSCQLSSAEFRASCSRTYAVCLDALLSWRDLWDQMVDITGASIFSGLARNFQAESCRRRLHDALICQVMMTPRSDICESELHACGALLFKSHFSTD